MITNSFIFLERISHTTEANIWQQGIKDWTGFNDAEQVKGISTKRKGYFVRKLAEARAHLNNNDSSYFAGRFPKSEIWRLYNRFRDECLFLDIETSGYYGDITVIGMYDGEQMMTMVKNRNLDKNMLKSILKRYRLLVTFNGLSFDVPVINRCFNSIVPGIPHLDLRFPLARLGFNGGLKNIERKLKILRSNDTLSVSGEDAVYLWHDYASNGNNDSLQLLVEYNTEDTVNLKPIADFVYGSMKKQLTEQFR
ncbi:ribonuclease H-like domain-containing protein [Nanoarchaeota archaeon]